MVPAKNFDSSGFDPSKLTALLSVINYYSM